MTKQYCYEIHREDVPLPDYVLLDRPSLLRNERPVLVPTFVLLLALCEFLNGHVAC